MKKSKDLFSRNEIKERVTKSATDMKEKEQALDDNVSDIETIRRTSEKIEGGTAEGYDQVTNSIETAENITTDDFNAEDNNLEKIQEDSNEFGIIIEKRKEYSESDLGKLSDASKEFKTQKPDKDFLRAKEEALHDIDLLKDQREKEELAREKSDAIQEDLRKRVSNNKRR